MSLLIDTNVFIDHLRGKVDLSPLFRRRHKYSFVSAQELLGLDQPGSVGPDIYRFSGTHQYRLNEGHIARYLIRASSLPYNLSLRHWFGNAINPKWVRKHRRTIRLLVQFKCLLVNETTQRRAKRLLSSAQASDDDINDALIAATAEEHGLHLLTADAGFSRFPVVCVHPAALPTLSVLALEDGDP